MPAAVSSGLSDDSSVPEEAPPSSNALKNTVISAVSNLSTAYNLVVINIVHVLIQNQYCGGDNCEAETEIVSTASLVGAIIGQLTFGYVGDWLGRSRALQLTMAMSVFGALLSAFAVPVNSDPASIFLFLSATRFALGLGVGGVYPLSATIAAESSSKASRGRNASLVFSMQGVANVLVPVLALACVSIFGALRCRHRHHHCCSHHHCHRYRLRCGLPRLLPLPLLLPMQAAALCGNTAIAIECNVHEASTHARTLARSHARTHIRARTQTQKQTQPQTQTQTQTDTDTDRQTDRHTHTP